METLAELLRVAEANLDQEPGHRCEAETDGHETTLIDRLLCGVRTGLYHTDEAAANDLYGAHADDRRYRTLKTRAYDRVLRMLMILRIKAPEHSEVFAIYYRCLRNLVATQTLVRLRAHRAAYSVALRTMALSERYEFTDIVVPLSLVLRNIAALWNRRQAFDDFNAKYRKAIAQLQAEQEADYRLDLLHLETRATSTSSADAIERQRECAAYIAQLYEDHPSTTLHISKARAEIRYRFSIRDFDTVDRVCDEIIRVIQSGHLAGNRARLAEFNIHRMAAHLFRRSNIPQAVLDGAYRNLGAGGHNWFVAKSLHISSALLNGSFAEAENVYLEATRNERFRLLEASLRERWLLFHAHLALAEILGLFAPVEPRAAGFRLSTFLNSVPNESRDKKNSNLIILILQSIYLVCMNQRDDAERRIQYLNVYASRYLRNETHSRAYVMIKALQYVPRYAHRPAELRAMLAPSIDRIREAASHPMPGEINELLPYDVLLEALLRRLASQTSV